MITSHSEWNAPCRNFLCRACWGNWSQ